MESINQRQIRGSLLAGAAAFGALLALVLLMLFTPVFSGTVGGVGTGYVVGFLDFALVLVAAYVYCRIQNRLDADAEGGTR